MLWLCVNCLFVWLNRSYPKKRDSSPVCTNEGTEAVRPLCSRAVLVYKEPNMSSVKQGSRVPLGLRVAGPALQLQCLFGVEQDHWEPRHQGQIPRCPLLCTTQSPPQASAMLGNAWEDKPTTHRMSARDLSLAQRPGSHPTPAQRVGTFPFQCTIRCPLSHS